MERSAVPGQTKRNTLFQEGIRCLTAMDPRVSEEERTEVMAKFMVSLRASGYSHAYREGFLKGDNK